MTLRDELRTALNRTCAENSSNTPDFILAEFLIGCLNAFDVATNERTAWYDPKIRAGAAQETPAEQCGAVNPDKGLHCQLPFGHESSHRHETDMAIFRWPATNRGESP